MLKTLMDMLTEALGNADKAKSVLDAYVQIENTIAAKKAEGKHTTSEMMRRGGAKITLQALCPEITDEMLRELHRELHPTVRAPRQSVEDHVAGMSDDEFAKLVAARKARKTSKSSKG